MIKNKGRLPEKLCQACKDPDAMIWEDPKTGKACLLCQFCIEEEKSKLK